MTQFVNKTILNIRKNGFYMTIRIFPNTFVSNLMTYFKIEPPIDNWISISTVKKNLLENKYVLKENYYFKNTNSNATCKDLLLLLPFYRDAAAPYDVGIASECDKSVFRNEMEENDKIEENKLFRSAKYDMCNNINGTENFIGSLIVKKGENKFIINHLFSRSTIRDFSTVETSDVEILDVVYKNNSDATESRKEIIIDLPKSTLLVGNDILSNVYILRYLKYKNMEKYFNENYEINILLTSPSNGNKLEQITLNNNQYMKMYKNTYKDCIKQREVCLLPKGNKRQP